MDESTRDDGEDASTVVETLQRLKRAGSRLLVTGSVSAAVRAQQTRHLLGSPEEDRARILALADDSSPSAHLPEGPPTAADRVAVVEHRGDVRSATVARAEPLPPRETATDSMAAFYEDVLAAVAADRRANGAPAPATLRVGVVGGGALVDRHGLDRSERMLRSLGDTVVADRGMFHCHVAAASDAAVVDALLPSFDVHVELRHREGLPPEQRWSFPETDERTEWMLL
ncbi:DUF7504 family protein [Halomarina oriensis]|uniref:Uncharacterized protein n=1 Tax=Halomarina oriensis TaxID=671145 RepID=A0A6B0GPZ2_9EURY|nr:hypothetical protein [Halomarina oriensis]MWG34185.1 hypothetical protein [Halomarina oriensis]